MTITEAFRRMCGRVFLKPNQHECAACNEVTYLPWDEARAIGWTHSTWYDGEACTPCPECQVCRGVEATEL